MSRTLIAICVVAVPAGCASAPTHFVTLDVAAAPHRTLGVAGMPVALGRVALPPELDRDHPVRRTGDNSLDVASQYRWAAPLDERVHRTLALDLASRLPKGEMLLHGQPTPAGPLRVVVVTVRFFSANPTGDVKLDARWSAVLQPSDRIESSRDAAVSVRADSGSWDDMAGAMSGALLELADRIAATMGSHEGP